MWACDRICYYVLTAACLHAACGEATPYTLMDITKELEIIQERKLLQKEPELAKLVRRLKSTPVLNIKKKFTGFSRMSEMANLLCFGCFTVG